MIHGLLHGRLLGGGGGPPPGVVNPPGFAGAHYFTSDYTLYGGSAALYFDVNPDGTWGVRDHDGNILGSGNWYAPSSAGVGAGYELQITATKDTGGSSSITNTAASFVALSATRTLVMAASYSGTAGGDRTTLFNVSAVIRLAGGATVSSGSFVGDINVGSTGGG